MNAGYYKRRRGILEHIETGEIDLLESGIHDWLSLKANLLIGSDCSIPVGICFSSAPAIRPYCKRWVKSDRTMQRVLGHMEDIGWIKTWPQRSGNYPVLLCRASVHDLSGTEYRINAEATTDWRSPIYEPVGELSVTCPQVVGKVAGYREKRTEIREKKPKTLVQQKPLDEIPFTEFWSPYPKKEDKAKALLKWQHLSEADRRAAIEGISRWQQSGRWDDPQYIPMGSSYLNRRRWEDEIAIPNPQRKGYDPERETAEAIKRVLADREPENVG